MVKGNSKLLDSKNPYKSHLHVDILNNCFGVGYLGKRYKTPKSHQKGGEFFSVDDTGYFIWFPVLAVNGKPGAKHPGWINEISDDENVIEEYGLAKEVGEESCYRLVFTAKNEKDMDGKRKRLYTFRGVFKFDMDRSTVDHHYYCKVADVADFRKSKPVVYLLKK